MATGSQSDVSEDFNEQTVEKKKSKHFSKPKIFKSKPHPDEKHSTDISSSPPPPFYTPKSPPVDIPKPPPIDDQAWVSIPIIPSNVSPIIVHPSTEKVITRLKMVVYINITCITCTSIHTYACM